MTAKTTFSKHEFSEILSNYRLGEFKDFKSLTKGTYRTLNKNEKRHMFDVYKLSIMFDCIWYFERGDGKDFYEKRKIDRLNSLGREKFYDGLFANT